ncbi:MAG: hypothetical protein CMM62_18895, partial [Rhodospirillaceae bacterium]|nr:hypothetical protein [Rhodospirillaceae bacterium]
MSHDHPHHHDHDHDHDHPDPHAPRKDLEDTPPTYHQALADAVAELLIEKGAFTGANTANKGYLRAADGGTLLLDEISEMPMALQAKLLRVIQEKVVTPLGSQTEAQVDVRILA